jgi:hypothetical protein
MPRAALDLNTAEDRQKVKGQWKVATGLVPGEPNEGLTAQLLATPARLADYDDSGWQVCPNIRESLSVGFTFAWYRITVELPERVNGMNVAGSRVWFETNTDIYGEIWINGQIDRSTGVIVAKVNGYKPEGDHTRKTITRTRDMRQGTPREPTSSQDGYPIKPGTTDT